MSRRALSMLLALALWSSRAAADIPSPFALLARLQIVEMRLDDAAATLSAGGDGKEVAIERARLALYRGDCDAAVALLDNPVCADDESAAELLPVAKGCARAMAAAIVRHDGRGVTVRFQDAADEALFPLLADTALRVRELLAREIGARLPNPIFIDMVRDQLSLAALSGLSEKAARTTGTVAVAKWGRVLILSPRAVPHGFAWLDTLAHEMTHLAQAQASRDRAPLWLQEGVAKREEIRWRERTLFDGLPPADDVAAIGIARGLGLPLTGLGPSIAMLPSAEAAMVAFAEVSSFMAYWVENAPQGALPKLYDAMKHAGPFAKVEDAVKDVSGTSLADWEKRWRAWLASRPHPAPEELAFAGMTAPGSAPDARRALAEKERDLARGRRLSELLLDRGHAAAAVIEARRGLEAWPGDAAIRAVLATALRAEGEHIEAMKLVAEPRDIRQPTGRWWSLNAQLMLDAALPHARDLAVANQPYEPSVACDELPRGELPGDPVHRALCLAARAGSWE